MINKISIIGAGFVGAKTAQRIVEKELADVVLVDIDRDLSMGKALDILSSGPLEGFDSKIYGTEDYKDIAGSKIVVITAGVARKPGMSRDDLININGKIVAEIAEKIKVNAPESIIIVVTNPLDVMTYVAFKKSGFKPNKVIGMAGVLDTARYRAFISMELGISVEDIHAMVLGSHGDEMVPLVDYTTVSGIPVKQFLSQEAIDRIIERTRKGGIEIVNLLKTGSAYYAPSSSIVQMIESILKDKKRILPASAYLNGEYGITDSFVGVPIIIGANGVEKVIELKLEDENFKQLQYSASVIKENIEKLGNCLEPA